MRRPEALTSSRIVRTPSRSGTAFARSKRAEPESSSIAPRGCLISWLIEATIAARFMSLLFCSRRSIAFRASEVRVESRRFGEQNDQNDACRNERKRAPRIEAGTEADAGQQAAQRQ